MARPRLSPTEPTTSVHVKVPNSLYDRAYQAAQRQCLPNVPALIRIALAKLLKDLETQTRQPK